MERVILTADMRAIIDAAHLCFAASVNPDGTPNLSPKGTIRVWDDEHLFFLDIDSPNTRRNLSTNPWIELNVVDQLSRRGYRFFGRATLHRANDVFERATRQVFAEEGSSYPVECAVLIEVQKAAPLVSPGYLHVPDEASMRAIWKVRRGHLDAGFEAHAAMNPFRSASVSGPGQRMQDEHTGF